MRNKYTVVPGISDSVLNKDVRNNMKNNNLGNQSGNESLNVGKGDFQGAYIHIGDNIETQNTIPIEKLMPQRKIVLGGHILTRRNFNIFGIVSGFASIAGFILNFFNIFAPLFIICLLSFITLFILRKQKFSHLFYRYYLEAGNRDNIYVTKLTAVCPWCSSRMALINLGPKNGPKDDIFVCERNPKHHRVILDPTVLEEINDNNILN